MSTDTPRCDAESLRIGLVSQSLSVPTDFARQLERELAAEQEKCKRLRESLVTIRDECFSGCAHDVAERALATLEATK